MAIANRFPFTLVACQHTPSTKPLRQRTTKLHSCPPSPMPSEKSKTLAIREAFATIFKEWRSSFFSGCSPEPLYRPNSTLGQKTLGHPTRTPRIQTPHPPVATTFSRNLACVEVEQFQEAFAEFLHLLLSDKTDSLTVAIDGKAAKQMPDELKMTNDE